MVTYVYQLIDGEVRVAKVEYRCVHILSPEDLDSDALGRNSKPLEVASPRGGPMASPQQQAVW